MSKHFSIYNLALAALLTLIVFMSSKRSPLQENPTSPQNVPQIVKAVDLNRPFDFAGEPLPMDNFDVRERLDRELLVNTYWQSSTMLHLKNANKFFPLIERVLQEEGVPDDFKYLAVAESGLRNVTSPAGARGFWQIMKATAGEYKLEVREEVDERYHLEKATRAACRLLKNYHRRFGSWTLVAAAYNAGIGKIGRQLEEQRADTYYDLNLNPETGRYLFRLVAIKEILSRPADFGFYLDQADLYPPLSDYDTVEVTETIPNLGDFAIQRGTSYRLLKVYNPWLRTSRLTVKEGDRYLIKLPR